jgi:hypothetical protein
MRNGQFSSQPYREVNYKAALNEADNHNFAAHLAFDDPELANSAIPLSHLASG